MVATLINQGFRSTAGGGGSSLVVSAAFTLENTSGSTQSTGFVPHLVGLGLKKGDITGYPILKAAGSGTVIPYTLVSSVNWSDGSRKHLSLMIQVPVSIAGSGTQDVDVWSGGSAPAASGLSVSQLTTEDLKVELTGIDNLSGTWTSAIRQGVTDNDDHHIIADGDAGIVGRTRQQFMDTGPANHGQLECYHYWQICKAPGGGLGFFRWLPWMTQPWHDVNSPAKNKRGFSAAMKNGSSTSGITQPSTGAAKSYTATNGNPVITVTGHGWDFGVPVRLSTPPSPFSGSTTYYVGISNSNAVQLYPTSFDAISNTNTVTPTANGSGTMTPAIEIVHFASFFGAASNKWQFVQGAGSVTAEPTIRVRHNKTYLRSTRLIPVYNTSTNPDPYTATQQNGSVANTYTPMGKSALRMFFDQTGEDQSIGVLPGWCATHFQKQTSNEEAVVRATALSMAIVPMYVKNSSTMTIPVLNANGGTPYAGMGTANKDLRWDQNPAHTSGITNPSGDTQGAINAYNTSHWCEAIYYAYLITGEPQYADMIACNANYSVLNRAGGELRNPTTGGTFYGCVFQDEQPRDGAWAYRTLSTAHILPTTPWENANLSTYLRAMHAGTIDSIIAFNGAQNSFWNTNGLHYFRVTDSGGQPWQQSYMIDAAAFSYALSEDSDALTFLNHLVKFPAAVDADIGIYHWTGYGNRMRISDPAGSIVSAMNQIYWSPGGGNAAGGVASTDVMTSELNAAQFTLTANDNILYYGFVFPSGLSSHQVYFAVNVSDPGVSSNKTFKNSLTSGGSAVDITVDYGPGSVSPGYRLSVIPSGGTGFDYVSQTGYATVARSAFRNAEAVGATGMGSIRTKMDSIFNNGGLSFVTDPKLDMTTAF